MDSRFAVITFLEPGESFPGRPDNSLPGFPGRPNNDLPGGPNYPSNALPGLGGPILLPVFPFDPTRPDAGLPETPGGPSTQPIRPGAKFKVKWLACHGLILVPDNSLPDSGDEDAQPR